MLYRHDDVFRRHLAEQLEQQASNRRILHVACSRIWLLLPLPASATPKVFVMHTGCATRLSWKDQNPPSRMGLLARNRPVRLKPLIDDPDERPNMGIGGITPARKLKMAATA